MDIHTKGKLWISQKSLLNYEHTNCVLKGRNLRADRFIAYGMNRVKISRLDR